MAQRCIVVDCPNVSDSPTQPEAGWGLLKLSALMRGTLLAVDEGSVCPDCLRDKIPALRSPLQQQVKPAPELEPAAAAPSPPPEDAPTPPPETLAPAAAAGPESIEIAAGDVAELPEALRPDKP